jgi:hypothetical protein
VVQRRLNKRSVLSAKKDVNGYSEAKFRRDALLGETLSFPPLLYTVNSNLCSLCRFLRSGALRGRGGDGHASGG